jgi:beta-glucosidase
MIGDSITHWWEKFGKNRPGGQKVWNEYYAKRNAVNLGFAGDRTENVIWRLQNGEVKGISPKLAVLLIGTNNADHRKEDPKDTALGIQTIISELRTRLPKTKILLLAIFPRGIDENDALRKLNEQTNTIIAKFADDKKVFFLNINSKFLGENGQLSKKIIPDLLHPNENGYRIWAEAMEPTIEKLMGEK